MKLEKEETYKLELTKPELRKLNYLVERALDQLDKDSSVVGFGKDLVEKADQFI